jgi:hypothetical protein
MGRSWFLVHPRYSQRARDELCSRFAITLVDFEALFIKVLHEVADQARVNWDLVLKTDARPHQGDWPKLMVLVDRAMPLIEAQLLAADTTILVVYAGLLARYDRMDFLQRFARQDRPARWHSRPVAVVTRAEPGADGWQGGADSQPGATRQRA